MRAVSNARENARTLRPLVSTEMWMQLNVFYNRLNAIDAERAGARRARRRCLTEIKEACQTFTGITEGTFYRDQAWYFYRLGRYIERADQTTRLLDIKYHLLLPQRRRCRRSRSTSANGRRCCARPRAITPSAALHPSDLTPARVAAFLLFNPAFPRSVHLCVREVERALDRAQIALRAARRQRRRRGSRPACARFSSRARSRGAGNRAARVHRLHPALSERHHHRLVDRVFRPPRQRRPRQSADWSPLCGHSQSGESPMQGRCSFSPFATSRPTATGSRCRSASTA